MKALGEQFADLQRVFPHATLQPTAGVHLIVIPSLPLPSGWSQAATHVRFVAPNGYPYAAPDTFWADGALRLASGAMPKNTVIGNPMPGQADPTLLWFSWHITGAGIPPTAI